jgi:hypothetical protein
VKTKCLGGCGTVIQHPPGRVPYANFTCNPCHAKAEAKSKRRPTDPREVRERHESAIDRGGGDVWHR